MTRVVLASANRAKLRELAQLLSPLSLTAVPQETLAIPSIAETGRTRRPPGRVVGALRGHRGE